MIEVTYIVVSGILWVLWKILVVLYTVFPFYLIAWPATFMVLLKARDVYRESGGGIVGIGSFSRYVFVKLPSTMRDVFKWIVVQIAALVRWHAGYDLMERVPSRVREWFGEASVSTRQEKVTEKIVYRYKQRSRLSDEYVLLKAIFVVLPRGALRAFLGLLIVLGVSYPFS